MSTDTLFSSGDAITRDVGTGGVREKRLCVGSATNLVVEAGAGAVRTLGIPKWTAAAGEKVTVERHKVLSVLYDTTAVCGDPLIAKANGCVAPAGADPDARFIVGHCEADVTVSSGEVSGFAYIN